MWRILIQKNKILLILLKILCHAIYGQNKKIMDSPCDEYVNLYRAYEEVITRIDSLNQIPTKYQFIVKEIIKKSMADFQDNITFIKGQIINLESWFSEDSTSQIKNRYERRYKYGDGSNYEYETIIPKYQLFFELSDHTIGVKRYCFKIGLDPYGQITYFNCPRKNYYNRASFINPEAILKLAVKCAEKKGYKTSSYVSSLWYDWRLDKLCWEISFLQNSSDEYRQITIDAIKLEVLKEEDIVLKEMIIEEIDYDNLGDSQ